MSSNLETIKIVKETKCEVESNGRFSEEEFNCLPEFDVKGIKDPENDNASFLRVIEINKKLKPERQVFNNDCEVINPRNLKGATEDGRELVSIDACSSVLNKLDLEERPFIFSDLKEGNLGITFRDFLSPYGVGIIKCYDGMKFMDIEKRKDDKVELTTDEISILQLAYGDLDVNLNNLTKGYVSINGGMVSSGDFMKWTSKVLDYVVNGNENDNLNDEKRINFICNFTENNENKEFYESLRENDIETYNKVKNTILSRISTLSELFRDETFIDYLTSIYGIISSVYEIISFVSFVSEVVIPNITLFGLHKGELGKNEKIGEPSTHVSGNFTINNDLFRIYEKDVRARLCRVMDYMTIFMSKFEDKVNHELELFVESIGDESFLVIKFGLSIKDQVEA